MKQKKFTISIAIPTYEANDHLVTTLKSIYRQSGGEYVKEITVLVDGKKLRPEIFKLIKNRKLKVVEFNKRVGQSARINDALKMAKSDFLILTNDDVIWRKNALIQTFKAFSQKKIDLLCGRVAPIKETSLFGKVQTTGQEIADRIKKTWNNGDNYLSANGRFLGVSRKMAKNTKIPTKIWNNDAYLYLWAKTNNYQVATTKLITCNHRLPNNLKEYAKQSQKFKNSQYENQPYFRKDISFYYKIPRRIKFDFLMRSLIEKPKETFILILINTSVSLTRPTKRIVGYWETDYSTKNLKLRLINLLA